MLTLLAAPGPGSALQAEAASEESKVIETGSTIEELRLDRLAGSGIAHEALIGRLGDLPSAKDSESLSELGRLLWRSAVEGVQSAEIRDDRALYWARLKVKSKLRGQIDDVALATLETGSRGMGDIDFSDDAAVRVIVTGFDPFHLDRQIDQSNPSGLAALALDGRTLATDNGPAHVQAAVFPVRFADFDAGMVETFIAPLLKPEARVDLVLTISMGREGFDLERFPGRRRSSAVTDNLNVLTGADPDNPLIPSLAGRELSGPEFLEFTLPADAMVVVPGDFPVRDNRNVATLEAGDLTAPELDALNGQTAVRGSGGGYLSNEIAYRTLRLNERRIPMGHIHTPRLVGFDPEFEQKVLAQIEALLIAAVEALPR